MAVYRLGEEMTIITRTVNATGVTCKNELLTATEVDNNFIELLRRIEALEETLDGLEQALSEV